MTIWFLGGNLLVEASNTYAASNASYWALVEAQKSASSTTSSDTIADIPSEPASGQAATAKASSTPPSVLISTSGSSGSRQYATTTTTNSVPNLITTSTGITISTTPTNTNPPPVLSPPPPSQQQQQQQVRRAYGQLPIAFETNQGHFDSQAKFLAHGRGYNLFLTPDAKAVLDVRFSSGISDPKLCPPGAVARVLPGCLPFASSTQINKGSTPISTSQVISGVVLRMSLAGISANVQVAGQEELLGRSHYFIGSNPSQWHTNIQTFARVAYTGVYPGVDMSYYGTQSNLEYDFRVAPNVDPSVIALNFEGADQVELAANGELILHSGQFSFKQRTPQLYQMVGGNKTLVAGGYVSKGANQVGFQVGVYDHSLPLVIDPVLDYSTYLGGNGNDFATGIAVDASGNVYVTGSTTSSNFPLSVGAYQQTVTGDGYDDAFVTKINASGSAVLYSTYLGGAGRDSGLSIAINGSGNAYITGYAAGNFPTTTGAYQPTFGGGYSNGYVTELNTDGSGLVYSTYLGGNGSDDGASIALDTSGNAYVVGIASGTNFTTTAGAYQTTYGGGSADSFVVKLNVSGTAALYSTYLGGSGDDYGLGIALDTSNNAYIVGYTSGNFTTTSSVYQSTYGGGSYDTFVAKLNASGTAAIYSTYLGGSGADYGYAIALDTSNNAYVSGYTTGSFTTTTGAFQTSYGGGTYDGFVAKLNTSGTALYYSTYLGGNGDEYVYGIGVDSSNNAYITGGTYSTNFSTTAGAYQTVNKGGSDAFLTKLNASGTALLYSTYLGGSSGDTGRGLVRDSSGNVYLAGETISIV